MSMYPQIAYECRKLSTIVDQKTLYIDPAKATLAQEFAPTMNREFRNHHDTQILKAHAGFL